MSCFWLLLAHGQEPGWKCIYYGQVLAIKLGLCLPSTAVISHPYVSLLLMVGNQLQWIRTLRMWLPLPLSMPKPAGAGGDSSAVIKVISSNH